MPAGGLVVTPSMVLISLLTGTALTVYAGLVPAVRASRVTPLEALREAAAESGAPSRRRAAAGVVFATAGLGVVLVGLRGSGNAVLASVGVGAVLSAVGFVVLGPAVARAATGLLGLPIARWRGAPGVLARRNAMRSPRRSAAAATALTIGVAVVTLFTVYAASIEAAITSNFADAVTADIAITTGSFGSGGSGGGGVAPQLESGVSRVPDVAVSTGLAEGKADIAGRAEQVTVVDPPRIGRVLDLQVTAGSLSGLTIRQIAISRHAADTRHWHLGTMVGLILPDGTRAEASVGAIYTTGDLTGDFVLPISLWAPHTAQLTGSTIFVKLVPGASVSGTETAVRRVAAAYGQPVVENRAAYVAGAGKALNLFLGIVYVLLAVAIVIAVSGIANTLSLAINERTREIGLLRAVGQTQRQLRCAHDELIA